MKQKLSPLGHKIHNINKIYMFVCVNENLTSNASILVFTLKQKPQEGNKQLNNMTVFF